MLCYVILLELYSAESKPHTCVGPKDKIYKSDTYLSKLTEPIDWGLSQSDNLLSVYT